MGTLLSDLLDDATKARLRAAALAASPPATDDVVVELKANDLPALEHKGEPVATQVLETDDETGLVRALVSVTGVEDRVKDIIEVGSYAKTLSEREPIGVWSHDDKTWVARADAAVELMPGDPIFADLKTQDGKPWPKEAGALMVDARFNLDTPHGAAAYSDVKFFAGKTSWSIGYRATKAHRNPRTGVRHIKELQLFEFSPVMVGAASQAMTLSVKSLADAHTVDPDDPTGLVDEETLAELPADVLARKDALLEDLEAKAGGVRRVRTPAGARRFGAPIGSVILADGTVQTPSGGSSPAGGSGAAGRSNPSTATGGRRATGASSSRPARETPAEFRARAAAREKAITPRKGPMPGQAAKDANKAGDDLRKGEKLSTDDVLVSLSGGTLVINADGGADFTAPNAPTKKITKAEVDRLVEQSTSGASRGLWRRDASTPSKATGPISNPKAAAPKAGDRARAEAVPTGTTIKVLDQDSGNFNKTGKVLGKNDEGAIRVDFGGGRVGIVRPGAPVEVGSGSAADGDADNARIAKANALKVKPGQSPSDYLSQDQVGKVSARKRAESSTPDADLDNIALAARLEKLQDDVFDRGGDRDRLKAATAEWQKRGAGTTQTASATPAAAAAGGPGKRASDKTKKGERVRFTVPGPGGMSDPQTVEGVLDKDPESRGSSTVLTIDGKERRLFAGSPVTVLPASGGNPAAGGPSPSRGKVMSPREAEAFRGRQKANEDAIVKEVRGLTDAQLKAQLAEAPAVRARLIREEIEARRGRAAAARDRASDAAGATRTREREELAALNRRRRARGLPGLLKLPASGTKGLDVASMTDAELDVLVDTVWAEEGVEVKGSRASLDRSPGSNWVESAGSLPGYVREVARGIERTGKPLSTAIAMAISRIKRWARGGDGVKADTVAKAIAAVAQWEALKAKNAAKYDSVLLELLETKGDLGFDLDDELDEAGVLDVVDVEGKKLPGFIKDKIENRGDGDGKDGDDPKRTPHKFVGSGGLCRRCMAAKGAKVHVNTENDEKAVDISDLLERKHALEEGVPPFAGRSPLELKKASDDPSKQPATDAQRRQAVRDGSAPVPKGKEDGSDKGKRARYVRTAAGEARYGVPIGQVYTKEKSTGPLAKGDAGERTRAAQAALIKAGMLAPDAGSKGKGDDGYYGPKTEAAVKAFQEKNGLEATGELDVDTLRKLTGDDGRGKTGGKEERRPAERPGVTPVAAQRLKVRRLPDPKPRPGARRVNEDEVPMKSRGGAKLVDYNGSGSGAAIYADGTVFDGRGWQAPGR